MPLSESCQFLDEAGLCARLLDPVKREPQPCALRIGRDDDCPLKGQPDVRTDVARAAEEDAGERG